MLLSGPPGIGKTTAAHMACRSLSIEKVEMNASDTRSKATLHEQVSEIIDNKSLSGFSQFFSKVPPAHGSVTNRRITKKNQTRGTSTAPRCSSWTRLMGCLPATAAGWPS